MSTTTTTIISQSTVNDPEDATVGGFVSDALSNKACVGMFLSTAAARAAGADAVARSAADGHIQ